MPIDRHTMTTLDAARALGVSVERVRQLDDALKPARSATGHRRYDPAVVRRLLAKRERTSAVGGEV